MSLSRWRVRLGGAAILAASLTWGLRAGAQWPDLVDVSGQYMPSARLPETPPAAVQVSSYDASANAPIPLGETTFLIPGMAYHVDAVSFSSLPPGFVDLRAFHSIDPAALFVQLLPANWALSVRASAGIAGDMEEVDSGLLRISGLLMATYGFSDDLVLGGGAIGTWNFGTFLPLPAIYADWTPIPELRFEGFLPAFVNLQYLPHPRLEFGLRGEFSGNSYGIRDSRIRSRWPCASDGADDPHTAPDETKPQASACLDNIAYSTGSVGITYAVRIFDTVWVNGYAAHTFYRRFEPLSETGDTLWEEPIPNQAFVRLGATWRLPEF